MLTLWQKLVSGSSLKKQNIILSLKCTSVEQFLPSKLKGLFTHKSDFALSLKVYKANYKFLFTKMN
jgi:hypothetical protein